MRQFYLPTPADAPAPEPGDELHLPSDETRHLLRVLRATVGDAVSVTDGRGLRLDAVLRDAAGREARLEVVAVARDEVELATPRLVLACGVIKGRRWEWLLEKAVELGVHEIAPLLTRHAEVDPGAGKRRRWETLLHAAVKQSGRTWCPRLHDPATLAAHLERDDAGPVCYGLARARGARPGEDGLLDARDLTDPDTLIVGDEPAPRVLQWCVGPEGGWSDDEIALLTKRGRAVRLGPHRLRTETAATTGLAFLATLRDRLLRR